MSIHDIMIDRVLKTVIKNLNSNVNMEKILHDNHAVGRTMNMIITDLKEGDGFSVIDGILVTGIVENPTCVVEMNKNVLVAIILGKMTQNQAFLLDEIKIYSNERLRDSIVLNRIFNEMKKFVKP